MRIGSRIVRRIKREFTRRVVQSEQVQHLVEWKRHSSLILRRWREAESRRMPPEIYADARFYQFTKATAKMLWNQTGRTDIRVGDTPHFELARALEGGADDQISGASERYKNYLSAQSVSDDITTPDPDHAGFFESFERMKNDPGYVANAVLARSPNSGEYLVCDGNASLAIALVLNRDIQVKILPFDLAFRLYSSVPEFYGTQHNDRPYQSIYMDGKIVVPGRREDVIERLQMIPAGMLTGASVLDVASNFGMSSILSCDMGATSVLGLERSRPMVDLATRFAMLSGAYPMVQFRCFDIDIDSMEDESTFDISFMYSIYAHLADPSRLARIVDRHVRGCVIFESHPGGRREDYREFFESGLFRSVTPLGVLSQSVYKPEKNRTLWLCDR